MSWSTFPWQSVGACVAVIGLVIGALKLAVMWGKAQQKDAEHDRRIGVLEEARTDIPEELREKVDQHLAAAESGNRALRKTLARVVLAIRQLDRKVVGRDNFCNGMHGDAVQPMEDSVSDRIEIPTEVDDGPQG